MYHVKLGSIAEMAQPNFVVCSPSLNTDDDCQYTNSSALKSVLSSAVQACSSSLSLQRNRKGAKFIYTDEKKEEDLSSQAIDEQDEKHRQFMTE